MLITVIAMASKAHRIRQKCVTLALPCLASGPAWQLQAVRARLSQLVSEANADSEQTCTWNKLAKWGPYCEPCLGFW